MEHQDTKLTSMRPRLKELNDNPYINYSRTKNIVTKNEEKKQQKE